MEIETRNKNEMESEIYKISGDLKDRRIDTNQQNQDEKISAERAKVKAEKERKLGHRRVGEGGEITYKKIQTSQIMGSIQLGIQHTVGSLASKPKRDLLMMDFWEIESIIFPPEGSTITAAHHFNEFRFKIYAPIAFRYFRDLFGIKPDDFMMSMCSASLRELSNPGASGSIFYLTNDDEFIIKTVQHKEGEFLQKLLPGYYMNLNQNPRTLLPKFFGLYCFQCNAKNVRLVVMNNLLPSSVKMHLKYDLKGSTYKRKASKSERNKSSPTYKDLDFMEHHPNGILLESETYNALIRTIQRDCTVLESFKIMDYSLLVGVHNLDLASKEKQENPEKLFSVSQLKSQKSKDDVEDSLEANQFMIKENRTRIKVFNSNNYCRSFNRQRLVAHSTAMESIQAKSEPIDEQEDVPPGGIPARSEKGERLLLYIGIIDILQSYRLKKKLEHTVKSIIHDGESVSVCRPSFYAQRFQNFMAKTVFKKIPSLDLPEIKGSHKKFRTLVSSYIALKHSPSKRKSLSKITQNQATPREENAKDLASKQSIFKLSTTNQGSSRAPENIKIKIPPPVPPRGSPKQLTHVQNESKTLTKNSLNTKDASYPIFGKRRIPNNVDDCPEVQENLIEKIDSRDRKFSSFNSDNFSKAVNIIGRRPSNFSGLSCSSLLDRRYSTISNMSGTSSLRNFSTFQNWPLVELSNYVDNTAEYSCLKKNPSVRHRKKYGCYDYFIMAIDANENVLDNQNNFIDIFSDLFEMKQTFFH